MAELGSCSNPGCSAGAEMTCSECDMNFCHGHAKHPEHSMPLDS
jgi:hypothetical protein